MCNLINNPLLFLWRGCSSYMMSVTSYSHLKFIVYFFVYNSSNVCGCIFKKETEYNLQKGAHKNFPTRTN